MRMFIRPAVAGIISLAALAACKNNNNDQSAGGTIDTAKPLSSDTAASLTATPASPMTPTTSDKWASPSVLGYTTVANQGEIDLGKLAEKKATSKDVKAFAKMMVTDHTAMLSDTKKLGTKLNVMADTAADDARDMMNHGRDALKELTDKAAGADWDKNYMDKMVDGHQDVLGKLQDAAKNTPDAEVKKALEAAVGKVQTHLTKAQDIRSKLK